MMERKHSKTCAALVLLLALILTLGGPNSAYGKGEYAVLVLFLMYAYFFAWSLFLFHHVIFRFLLHLAVSVSFEVI